MSPLDFELLVRDLIQEEFAVLLESFGPGRDSGIDFRFAQGADATIVQVKHYLDSGYLSMKLVRRQYLDRTASRLKASCIGYDSPL